MLYGLGTASVAMMLVGGFLADVGNSFVFGLLWALVGFTVALQVRYLEAVLSEHVEGDQFQGSSTMTSS